MSEYESTWPWISLEPPAPGDVDREADEPECDEIPSACSTLFIDVA